MRSTWLAHRGRGRHGIDHIEPQKIVIVFFRSSRGLSLCRCGVSRVFRTKKCGLAASAEMTRQVEISTMSAHQMAPAGVVTHSSSWTPAAYELEESAPCNSHIGGLSELPDGRREQGDKVENFLMDPTAGNAAGNRGGPEILEPWTSSCCQRSQWSPSSLVLCLVVVVSVFWDFGSLYLKASRRPSGQLLLQRQYEKTFWRPAWSDVFDSLWSTVPYELRGCLYF